MTITLNDVRRAASAIRGRILRSSCDPSRTLSEITGAEVILKFENLQFTASFKERGALVKLLSLSERERRTGVIAMSAGNHAQGVAYHAQRLGVPAVIVMPRFTPNVKVEQTRAFGAEVILHGETLDEAASRAHEVMVQRELTFLHPYDDEKVIAGQGTIALEMLEDYPDLEALLVPVGGGGLISGIAVAAKGLKPAIDIIGVETARFPSMLQAIRGLPIHCGAATFAEGIAVKQPGRITLGIVRQLVDDILLAEENDIEAAVLLLLEVEKTVVEGAGAVGLAALLNHRKRFQGRKVGLVLSGGNIDLLILSTIIQRGLARTGRLVRLGVEVPDHPGSLAEVTRILGASNANIVEVSHQRAFTRLSLKTVQLEVVLETRGLPHLREIMAAFQTAGFRTTLPDADDSRNTGVEI
ncbi:MAG: threonine ammonia-lyase [Desulfuromonadaceae bacterium]|nr:threonine ammonia-lyase [Desulfuromonadaceae bacterium]